MADLLYEVWVTTPDHLKLVRDVYDNTSMLNRLRGTYALPPSFPRTRTRRVGQPPLEFPVVLLSAGKLTTNRENLVYSHDPKPRYADLRDLSFSVPIRGLEIALVQYEYALLRHFDLPYIAFRVPKLDADPLLVSASGLGPFTFLIRRRTKRLYDDMVKAGAVSLPSNNRWRGP
jgi:hypothetical protein